MDRAVAVVLLLGTVVMIWAAMRRGWRRRADRQSTIPEPHHRPTDLDDRAVMTAESGLYIGTTTAGDWLDRVAAHGLGHRARSVLTVHRSGVLISRDGTDDIWIPASDLEGARVDKASAGKVSGDGGIVVISWRLGEQAVESGFRCRYAEASASLIMALDDVASGARP